MNSDYVKVERYGGVITKVHLLSSFRYTCVQCVDVELCCACEARQAHAQHYVLRIPGPRPQSEVEEVLSRVREAVGMVLFPRRTPEIDEPEIIKPEIEDEGIDDPLRDDPNARPHRLNILERAVIDIPPVKQECIEPGHAETSSEEPAIKEEVVDPGAEFIDTSTENTNTVFAHRPGSSLVPPAVKRRRVCPAPPQPPPSPGTSPRHTHNTTATATQDKQPQAVRPLRASSAGFHVMTHALRDSDTGSGNG
ncbi:hypothetical protein O0L34_g16757 [Tuta absoluta]|nr:hypothetical protein O0L34_g16757 [Tuta absoluta]